MSKLPNPSNQSHLSSSPRKLSRTLSLRSAEDKILSNIPSEENVASKYSGLASHRYSLNNNLKSQMNTVSSGSTARKKEKPRSLSRQNMATLSRDFKTSDPTGGYILPPLPSDNKSNNIPRAIHGINRIHGQEIGSRRQWGTKGALADSHQQQPKHSSSLPSIAEGTKNVKYKGNIGNSNLHLNQPESHRSYKASSPTSSKDIKKWNNRQVNNPEHFHKDTSGESTVQSNAQNCGNVSTPKLEETKLSQTPNETENIMKDNQIILPQHRNSESLNELPSTSSLQPHSSKSAKQSMIPKSVLSGKQGKDTANISVTESSDKDDASAVQKRKVSRFLRPDFFDTPPEESSYVKEREAKKAAEAEIKKAKRLARRTLSMREISLAKNETQNDNSNSTNESALPLNKYKNDKTANTSNINVGHISNFKMDQNEKVKSNTKLSSSLVSPTGDKSNKTQLWNSPQKGDSVRTSGNGSVSAKSRVGKVISSLQEHNFTPWDKKVVATESTYLKRAVSVDDVSLKSQGNHSFRSSNPKLGRKISSVLGLFSKLDSSSLDNQYLPNVSLSQNDMYIEKSNCEPHFVQNEQRPTSPVINNPDKMKSKTEENKPFVNTSTIKNETDNTIKTMKQPKTLKDSKSKNENKKNNKKVAVQVISEAISHTKEPQKTLLKSNFADPKSSNIMLEKTQIADDPQSVEELEKTCSLSLLNHTDKAPNFSKSAGDNEKSTTDLSLVNEIVQHPGIETYKSDPLPVANDTECYSKSALTNALLQNSPVDETESIHSWCASSDTDIQENQSLAGDDDDDDDKESESVEDRIRRKSFYSRFNDVKKKGRKKSLQFLKDCRTSLLPGGYHKNSNQPFHPQSSNSGTIRKKSPETPHLLETQDILGDSITESSSICHQNPLQETCKASEIKESCEKEVSSPKQTRILENNTHQANASPTNTCTLLRPAAFAHGILKKTPSIKTKTQPHVQSISIPELTDPVSSVSNVIPADNANHKAQTSTS